MADLAPISVKYNKLGSTEILWILFEFGNQLALDDRMRNGPGWINRNALNRRRQLLRPMIALACNSGMTLHDALTASTEAVGMFTTT
jgi:hypothetical protein